MRSLNLFYNLRRAVPVACVEDFVTEALCWLVSTSKPAEAELLRAVVGELVPAVNIDQRWAWSTQRTLASELGRSRPDMVGEGQDAILLFEHKVDAPVDAAQVAAHRENVSASHAGKRCVIVLITRDARDVEVNADAVVEWRRVQNALERATLQDTPGSLIHQFIEFLGLEGVGHIPGPCPTFWQACILGARQPGSLERRTYEQLGRKFAAAVIPDELAAMDNEVRGSDLLFMKAFEDALRHADPERAVWNLCRQFFPSYLLRTHTRFDKSVRIDDRQGRKFARGLIDAIHEKGWEL